MKHKIYKPNMNLLNDDGVDGSNQRWKKQNNIGTPYYLSFDDGHKTLNYIGAQHTTDQKSKTFRLIGKVIKKYNPDLVVIEGIPFDMGFNPDISYFQGEGHYATKLAKKNKIDYVGVEGNEDKILRMLSRKYNKKDIYGYDFLHTYKYFYKTMKVGKHELYDDIKQRIKNFDPDKWFMDTFGKKFRYGSYLEYASPYNGKDSNITQKISYDYSRYRNIMYIRNLYKLINKYNNILFIMGENHVYADKDILSDTFGDYMIHNI